jgi:hypothetical protein
MNYDELCKPMRDALSELGNATSSVEYDVKDSVEEADSEKDFLEIATARLQSIKNECDDWIARLRGSAEG